MKHSLVTGGLRYAPTSGYFRPTLRVVNAFITHARQVRSFVKRLVEYLTRPLPQAVLTLPPLHVLVRPKLFDDDETESLIETLRIVIEHKDHVAQGLTRAL